LLGVSAVPVEKDHTEEMVTQCIVEVLSNALSKPNAPPINPECKEILKKSGRNDRERGENKPLEVRHLKDPGEIERHHTESVEKEQSQAEEESKKYVKGSDEGKLVHEEDKSEEEEDEHHTPVQEETLHTEEKKRYQDIRREEEKRYRSEEEEESKESKHHDEELEHAVLSKKSHSGGTNTEEFPDGNDKHPSGHWHSEEGMQSPYERLHEGEVGEAEEERSEKYHHESKERDFSHQQVREESDESGETKEEKEPYRPKRYHGKHRMGETEENRVRGGEQEELAEESKTEEAQLWDKRNHHQKHHEESEQQREEKSGYHGRHGAEEVEEKRRADQGSEEYRERWQESEESSEEDKRHRHSEESNEKWREERKHHDGSREARRHHSEGRTYLGGASEEELDRYLSNGSKERQLRAGGSYHLWDNEDEGSQKAYTRERKEQARRRYSAEDSVEQQRYPGNSEEEEEEVEKKHQSSDQMENEEENMEEGRYAEREEYRSHLPAENEKRTPASYSPFFPLLWWKSRHFEKRNSAGDRLLEGKEEGRPSLNEKSLFPEYDDYDWWEKKQILSALKHGRTQKRNLDKMNRYDMKKQYNKMDQLAELLNYRKKSAEFPELYNSGEDMKKRHVIRSDRSLSQRPLTEEEVR
ncbi:SCG1 protein, partial [Todus mexicanus]|nr:SCG1 protein [Todus mexicanus]